MRISLDQLKKLIREEVYASSQKLIREQDLWDAEELDAEAAAEQETGMEALATQLDAELPLAHVDRMVRTLKVAVADLQRERIASQLAGLLAPFAPGGDTYEKADEDQQEQLTSYISAVESQVQQVEDLSDFSIEAVPTAEGVGQFADGSLYTYDFDDKARAQTDAFGKLYATAVTKKMGSTLKPLSHTFEVPGDSDLYSIMIKDEEVSTALGSAEDVGTVHAAREEEEDLTAQYLSRYGEEGEGYTQLREAEHCDAQLIAERWGRLAGLDILKGN